MCIRDRIYARFEGAGLKIVAAKMAHLSRGEAEAFYAVHKACLLYTSDAADERSSVDLGGRRIIKKKTKIDDRGVL